MVSISFDFFVVVYAMVSMYSSFASTKYYGAWTRIYEIRDDSNIRRLTTEKMIWMGRAAKWGEDDVDDDSSLCAENPMNMVQRSESISTARPGLLSSLEWPS